MCAFVSNCNISNLFLHPNTPPNLWNSKRSAHKINSRYYELDCEQNVRSHHTQPRQSKYYIVNSSKSLVSRIQKSSQVPTTIYDRNFGHYVPAVLLHRTQHSPPKFQNKPTSVDSSNAIHVTQYSYKEIKTTRK